ncbi:MAG: response regulator, partial [Chitinophagaceae bacterium]|nr:response regulator [Chitinophagaceae bacterium]
MTQTNNLTHILIIDDDEDDFFITSEYIKKINDRNLRIDWCFKYKDAIEHIKERNYELYFIDYYLGARTGLDLIKEAVQLQCEEPLVLLTGKGNQFIDREAMQAGAMDYLVKSDLTVEKVERCIRYSLERATTVKALRANERKYRNIFERSKDAVFLASEQLVFRDVNDATSGLLQYSKPQLSSISLYDMLEEKENKFISAQLASTGLVNDREIELQSAGGEKKTCILSLSTERDINGGIFVHGLLHDVTELKKAEKATLQAEKLAATGRLVQTLAHEVRNPLNNINLSLEQLHHEISDLSDTEMYMEIIQRNSKRISDIITELLNSSRPAEMSMHNKPLQVIMDESIASALDRITLQKIKLQIKYADKPAYIRADEEKLKLAFLNIIINAVEAMEEDNGLLTISIENDKSFHTVRIKDNGSGIAEENLSKLFEPYFTSKRNGLGLG